MRVDLPEPEGPMIAVNRSSGKSTEMPFSACTSASPSPNTRVTSTAETIGEELTGSFQVGEARILGPDGEAPPGRAVGCSRSSGDLTRENKNKCRQPRSIARTRIAAVTAAATLALGVAACGDDEDDSGSEATESASAEEVTVTAVEYEFDLSATPTADTQSVTLDNQGKEPHALIFARINEGFTAEEAIQLQGEKGSAEIVAQTDAGPGQSKTVKLKKPAEAGEYAMLCPIGGPGGNDTTSSASSRSSRSSSGPGGSRAAPRPRPSARRF